MSALITDQAAYYSARAASYEEIYARPERLPDLDILHQRVADVLQQQDVLEVACGTGYWTERYAETAASVHAIDLNPDVLDIARARELDPAKVRFSVADAFDLQPEGSFTACFAAFWWSHVKREQQSAWLDHVRRQVGKDTLLVLIDDAYVEGSSTVIARTDLEGNTYQIRTLNGERYEVLKNFPTDSALRKKLAPAARDIRILRLEHYWMLTCRLK